MDNEELKLFYATEGNKEWEFVTKSKPLAEIAPEDFAHGEFCAAAIRYMLIEELRHNLTSERAENRYWAGLRLNQYRAISNKLYPDRN